MKYIFSITKWMPHYVSIGHAPTWLLQKTLENQVCREHKCPHFVGEMSSPIQKNFYDHIKTKKHQNNLENQ